MERIFYFVSSFTMLFLFVSKLEVHAVQQAGQVCWVDSDCSAGNVCTRYEGVSLNSGNATTNLSIYGSQAVLDMLNEAAPISGGHAVGSFNGICTAQNSCGIWHSASGVPEGTVIAILYNPVHPLAVQNRLAVCAKDFGRFPEAYSVYYPYAPVSIGQKCPPLATYNNVCAHGKGRCRERSRTNELFCGQR